MNTLTVQIIAQYIIIIEFALIFILVLSTYLLKGLFNIRSRQRQKYTEGMEDFFKTLIKNTAQYDPSKFKKAWYKIELIIPVLEKLSKEHSHTIWRNILQDFCNKTLLPLARKNIKSRNWALRYYVAQSFSLCYEKADESNIVNLLNDTVPLVFYAALRPALLSRSENCINAIITRLSGENWITKSLFLQVFETAPTTTRFIVERYLMRAVEPHIRATCYNILLEFPNGKLRWDMSKDLHSNFMNLKLAAIKYVAHVKKKKSIPILIDLLSDTQWEVRTVATRLLGELNAIQASTALAKCLRDPDWWVRLAAAQSLHSLGKQGDAILNSQDRTLYPDAYRVANHVLNRI